MIPPHHSESEPWQPSKFLWHEATLTTSMDTSRVVTDAGRAHIKTMGNNQGPHALACELICTRLAQWFGVPTLDVAVLPLTDADTFDLNGGRRAEAGPAFATRTIQAEPWDGAETTLKALCNADRLARLVVFDTWIRNDDRYPPMDGAGRPTTTWNANRGNLLITPEGAPPKELRFVAIDFGRGLTLGHELTATVNSIVAVRDKAVYGLFPAFRPFVSAARVREAATELGEVTTDVVRAIIDSVPREWDVSRKAS
ncbi:MAG: HipA family kinase, partial [Thermoguttaceae bacterium]